MSSKFGIRARTIAATAIDVGKSDNIYDDPVAAYDRIAPIYRDLSEQRRAYLDRVEQRVLSEMPAGSRSLLDVGSGDGSRSRRISQARDINRLVLLEPSSAMQGERPAGAEVWTMRAEELSTVQAEFDVILCLWNVLGHIFPVQGRREVLRQLGRLTTPRGAIFLDVNHRYNASHYGLPATLLRSIRDRISWRAENGDVVVRWKVPEHSIESNRGEAQCATLGHVFTDREFRTLAREAGLRIEKRFVVDYTTGELRRWSWQGNLLYLLRPASAPD